jgi:anti-sigma B factor antagonist
VTPSCGRVEKEGEVSVLALVGDLDFNVSGQINMILADLLGRGERYVLIDMAGATFLASPVIGALLGWAGRFRRRGGELTICNAGPEMREIFGFLGLHKFIGVFDDRMGALLATPADVRSRLGIRDRRHGEDRRVGRGGYTGVERRQGERRGTFESPRI